MHIITFIAALFVSTLLSVLMTRFIESRLDA